MSNARHGRWRRFHIHRHFSCSPARYRYPRVFGQLVTGASSAGHAPAGAVVSVLRPDLIWVIIGVLPLPKSFPPFPGLAIGRYRVALAQTLDTLQLCGPAVPRIRCYINASLSHLPGIIASPLVHRQTPLSSPPPPTLPTAHQLESHA